MDCDVFLDGYSDFRDGLLPQGEQAAFRAHLASCASCARYDRVLAQGVGMLRGEPELQVSEDFMARLQHRIYHEDEARLARGRGSRARAVAGTLAAAAAVGAVTLVSADGGPATADSPLAVQSTADHHLAAEAQDAQTGLGARLEQVGVQVYPMPYRDVLYRTASVATSAAHDASGEAAQGQ
jgi:anti-sigma factor RsiW